MSLNDNSTLLTAVSPETPCGKDLEYDDPLFGEMVRAAQRIPEKEMGNATLPPKEPDWNEVESKALHLLPRSKDLRIAVYLTKAWVHARGFEGLVAGLELILSLLQRYWDTVYPKLDPAEGNDPTERINTLYSLCDPETMLENIQRVTLVNFQALGKFSFYDIQLGLGHLKPPEASDHPPPKMSVIEAAFNNVKLDELKAITKDVAQSMDNASAVESFVTEKVGAKRTVNLSSLLDLLNQIHSILMAHLRRRTGDGASNEGVNVSATAPDSSPNRLNEKSKTVGEKEHNLVSSTLNTESNITKITCREDVVYLLDLICDYFKKHEPSSPVPLLLQRAKGLIDKDFIDILQDLTPAGVEQAKLLGGVSTDKKK